MKIFSQNILFLCMEQYFWGYGVIRKNNFSMAHLNGYIHLLFVFGSNYLDMMGIIFTYYTGIHMMRLCWYSPYYTGSHGCIYLSLGITYSSTLCQSQPCTARFATPSQSEMDGKEGREIVDVIVVLEPFLFLLVCCYDILILLLLLLSLVFNFTVIRNI